MNSELEENYAMTGPLSVNLTYPNHPGEYKNVDNVAPFYLFYQFGYL